MTRRVTSSALSPHLAKGLINRRSVMVTRSLKIWQRTEGSALKVSWVRLQQGTVPFHLEAIWVSRFSHPILIPSS